jgi:hypothetical protein
VLTSAVSALPAGTDVVDVEFDTREGRLRLPLSRCATFSFELKCSPVRGFPSYRGQRSFPGLWWFATTQAHIGHESWLERDQLMALDADPDVVGVVSQPFWLYWPDGIRHAPDYFARRRDGSALVVDVRDDDRISPDDQQKFDRSAAAMTHRPWLEGPQHALPRRVWPVHTETVHSYTMRLAQANHLPVKVLRLYLSGTPSNYHPRPAWLASASGYPLDLLEIRLKGLTRGHGFAEQLRRSRPACRLCMARRGIYVPVYCWLPEHRTACFRHRRWIGAPAHQWADQRQLDPHPAVVTAARRHERMVRQHKEFATFAMRDARRILNCWWREGLDVAPVLSLRDLTVDEYLDAYSDHVAVAAALANYRPHGHQPCPQRPTHRRTLPTHQDSVRRSLRQQTPPRTMGIRPAPGDAPPDRAHHPTASARWRFWLTASSSPAVGSVIDDTLAKSTARRITRLGKLFQAGSRGRRRRGCRLM